ncbi:YihY/virulence factor BrkB family protein [Sorangium cellulosum]|uniref:YihY/virulence factor BrkB family protein n=1 Tax=Sorangium cellulosum TaxID=56 RepID=UPI00031FD71F|nr:YihY/virulence factor BrkB family protein [Sorangium cellulosum]
MPARIRQQIARHRAAKAVWSVIVSLDRHNGPRAASAMAFDAFLSLIPLAAFAGYVLSRVQRWSDVVVRPILQAAPPDVATLVSEELIRLSQSSAVAPISITGFLWITSSGISTAMGVFDTIYNTRERPWYVRRAIAAACVMASLAVVPVVAGVGVLIGTLSGSTGARIVAFALPGGLVICMVAAFFRISIQRPNIERRRIFPGAVLTVVLWSAVSTLFSLYVATLGRYATFYGSLATVAIFLFWLWLLALALLIGGELNARLERERAGVTSIPPPGKWSALALSDLPELSDLPQSVTPPPQSATPLPLSTTLPQGATLPRGVAARLGDAQGAGSADEDEARGAPSSPREHQAAG